MGVAIESDFEPLYIVDADKKAKVSELKKKLKDADELLLATDEDREGEAIAWHLLQVLQAEGAGAPDGLPRDHPRRDPARARRDARRRPAARRRAGDAPHPRPALRLRGLAGALEEGHAGPLRRPRPVGRRAARRRARARAPRLRLRRLLGHQAASFDPGSFEARLAALDGKRVAQGRDFTQQGDAQVGRPGPARRGRRRASSQPSSRALTFAVRSADEKPYTRRPAAPFMTSTLQQEASRKLRYTSQTTMRVAQRLYENGYITYMRTDSTTLSESALTAARRAGRRALRRRLDPGAAAPVHAQGQERPGGARGDPPRRRLLPDAEGARAGAEPGRARALRPDLEAHARLADGGRPRPDRLAPARRDDADRARRRVLGLRHRDHVPRLPRRVRGEPRRRRPRRRRSARSRT